MQRLELQKTPSRYNLRRCRWVFYNSNVIAGTYTLKVIAEGFDPGEFKDIVVNADDTKVVQLGLRRFVGFEDEIAYDDGTDEMLC